ncbi:hypothetical protein BJ165DRAFT_1304485, partial [Panaeolus papilionaceus]
MISRCRAKMTIIQMTECDVGQGGFLSQKGLKGNVILFPQDVTPVAQTLPPSLNELSAPVCIIFVGSHKPSDDWLLHKAKPLTIRPYVVRRALEWLKINNELYRHVTIDHDMLDALPPCSHLTVPIHRYGGIENMSSLSSRYDTYHDQRSNAVFPEEDLVFEKTCVPEAVDVTSPSALRAAAAEHLKNGGHYLQIPHRDSPCNEFKDPTLMPMAYPTLFPYGIGGFEHQSRSVPLSFERQVQLL